MRPGQKVYAEDEYLGSNLAFYYIENVTTGEVQSFDNSAPYVGLGSADYINEKLGPYLPNFGSVPVTNNSFFLAASGGGCCGAFYYMGGNNVYQMKDGNGNLMSRPSSLQDSTGDFDQIFYASS